MTVTANRLCLPELPENNRVESDPPAFEVINASGISEKYMLLVVCIIVDNNTGVECPLALSREGWSFTIHSRYPSALTR